MATEDKSTYFAMTNLSETEAIQVLATDGISGTE
jgi:hypothetical protein